MSDYPEHEKLEKIAATSQAIGEFLEWLEEQGVVLCRFGGFDMAYPCRESKETLLAQHFQINLAKLEAEKRAMIATLRGN